MEIINGKKQGNLYLYNILNDKLVALKKEKGRKTLVGEANCFQSTIIENIDTVTKNCEKAFKAQAKLSNAEILELPNRVVKANRFYLVSLADYKKFMAGNFITLSDVKKMDLPMLLIPDYDSEYVYTIKAKYLIKYYQTLKKGVKFKQAYLEKGIQGIIDTYYGYENLK